MTVPWHFDATEAGRQLGHDFHRFSRLPPPPDWPEAVREGFAAAAAQHGPRRTADRFHRKWLQLRLGAWLRGRPVAADVTPALLAHLNLSHCPVTREPLTHSSRRDSDWSIDRLNNNAAYAATNLAVMSVRANRAKGQLGFDEVLARSQDTHAADGLLPVQWLRLAVLMEGPAFTDRQHLAPLLPLCAPLPACSVRLAVQQIQRLLALVCHRHADKNALLRALRPADHSGRSWSQLQWLGELVHARLKTLEPPAPCWDVWLLPGVLDCLRDWRKQLDDEAWARTAAIAGRLAGGSRVSPRSLQVWHLPTRGYQSNAGAWR